jgi:hypothetical protein
MYSKAQKNNGGAAAAGGDGAATFEQRTGVW